MNYTASEQKQFASTVIKQMGNHLQSMISAYNMTCGVSQKGDLQFQFRFRGSKTYNYCQVTLNGNDLYTMKIGQIRKKKGLPTLVGRYEQDGLYWDMLKPIFEKTTGLYLTLGTMGR